MNWLMLLLWSRRRERFIWVIIIIITRRIIKSKVALLTFLEECFVQHCLLEVVYHCHSARSQVISMGQWTTNCLLHYVSLLWQRSHSLPHVHLELSVVYIYIFISKFFQPFWLFDSKLTNERLCFHDKHNDPSFSHVFAFQFIVSCNFLISKELKSLQDVLLVIWVVDSSNFPFSIRKRPFVVLSDVYMIFLNDFTFEDKEEVVCVTTCFCYYLAIEIES